MNSQLFKAFILLFSISFLPTLGNGLYAQNKFFPGKVVDQKGDTLSVLIRKEGGKINPYIIDYKTSESGEVFKGDPSNVKMFQIDGGAKHVGSKVRVDRSSDLQAQLTRTPDPNWEERDVFLIEMLSSGASLYTYKSNNITRFYYRLANSDEFVALVYKKYNLNQRMRYNRSYRKQLQDNFSCGTNFEKLKDIDYSARDLVKFFRSYNECVGNEVEKQDVIESSGSPNIWAPTMGLNFISGEIDRVILSPSRQQIEAYESDLESSVGIRIGLALEKPLARSKGRSSLIFEGVFESISTSGQWEGVLYQENGVNQRGTQRVDISVNHIAFTIGFRNYFVRNENSKLFFSGSWMPNFVLQLNSSVDIQSVEGAPNTSAMPNVIESNSFIFGLGFKYRQAALEIKYNTNRKLLRDSDQYNVQYSAIGIALNFSLAQ